MTSKIYPESIQKICNIGDQEFHNIFNPRATEGSGPRSIKNRRKKKDILINHSEQEIKYSYQIQIICTQLYVDL